MSNALVPYKGSDLASCKRFDRASTYTANKRGDKMPPCLTPLETVKELEVDWPPFNTYFLFTMQK